MNKSFKAFLISYLVATVFYVYFFGNMNFFGETGFHMDSDTIVTILLYWSLPTALIISLIVYIINKIINKLTKKKN